MTDIANHHSGAGRPRGLLRRLRLKLIDFLAAGLSDTELSQTSFAADRSERDAFHQRLAELFAHQPSSLAGRLHFVNLSVLRDFCGARWPKVEATVCAIACRVIEVHLEPEDFYTRTDDAFVLVFPTSDERTAEGKCAQIGENITAAILAAMPEMPLLEIRGETAHVDSSILASPEALEAILRRDGADRSNTAAAGTPPKTPARPADAPQAGITLPGGHDFPPLDYRAIWNTHAKQVASYACLPRQQMPSADDRLLAEFDCHCLEKIINDAELLAAVRSRCTYIAIPVHLGTLTKPDLRQKFGLAARTLPKGFAERLIIEVVGLPTTLEKAEEVRLKASLAGLTNVMIARVPLGMTRFQRLREAGFVSVGLDVSGYDGPESKIMPLLDKHVEAANRVGLRTHIHGLKSLSLITAAVCAGFDHIDGDPISVFDAVPNEVYPLDPKRLYAHLIT